MKVFHEPERLQHQLRQRGWDGWVRASGLFFLYGSVTCVRANV